jgi:DNA invertase Pin-like site-specific DNA recombinase
MVEKGRAGVVKGERSGTAKLTAELVIELRKLNRSGIGYRRLARMFGVDRSTVCRAVNGVWWGHIKEADTP